MQLLPLTGTVTDGDQRMGRRLRDATLTPHGDGNGICTSDLGSCFDATLTPHGDGNVPSTINIASRMTGVDATLTPHGDGNI